jgi:ABC-type branched-subunit amino acid transport system substrate-binding protein
MKTRTPQPRSVLCICAVSLALAAVAAAKSVPRVAVIAPQSGSSAYFGKVVANGIVLSLKTADGGIEYRVLDDKSDPNGVAGLVQKAGTWGAVTIIGPLDSDVAAVAAKEALRLKIPLISPCATASYLTETGNRWFFRANTSDRQRADELASWSTELIARNGVLIVNEARSPEDQSNGRSPLYGEALATDLLRALNAEKQPASAVSFQRGEFNDATQKAIVDRVNEHAVGAIAVLSRSLEAVPITEFVRSRFPDLPVFLISPGRDQFSESRVKDGVYAVTDTVIEVTKSNVLEEFRRRYSLEFPGQPSPTQQCATFGYDAADIVLAAIKRAQQKIKTPNISALRASVREELAATPNDRQGLVSVGGFTKQQELNFRPHRVVLRAGTWVENGEVPRQDDLPSGRVAMYFAVLLLFLASLVALLVWQLPKLHRFGDRTVVFVISAIVGLVAALVTFGALRSYGHVSGQTLGVAFEFGGPAALFILVLLLGTRARKNDMKPFTVTVILHEETHGRGIVTVGGSMSLLLAKGAREATIKNGQAVFESLDTEYKNQSVDYVVSVPGYARFADAPQLRLTTDAVLYVRVRKKLHGAAAQGGEVVDSIQGGDRS